MNKTGMVRVMRRLDECHPCGTTFRRPDSGQWTKTNRACCGMRRLDPKPPIVPTTLFSGEVIVRTAGERYHRS